MRTVAVLFYVFAPYAVAWAFQQSSWWGWPTLCVVLPLWIGNIANIGRGNYGRPSEPVRPTDATDATDAAG